MIEEVRFNADGLVPVIAQDAHDGTILMLAWANKEALEETLETGFGTYFSRSRQKLWRKGEQSGNRQKVFEVLLDCDGDSVIYKVEQKRKHCLSYRPQELLLPQLGRQRLERECSCPEVSGRDVRQGTSLKE